VSGFIDKVKRRNILRSLDSCYIGQGCFALILDISWKKDLTVALPPELQLLIHAVSVMQFQ